MSAFSNFCEPTTPVFGVFATEGATIRIEPTGKVNVYVAGGSSGNSLETAVVQLTADALGVDIEDVNTIQGDTALTGFGGGTGGSRSGAMLAGAIGETAGGLRARIEAIAAHRLEAAVDDIEVAHGWAHVRGHADGEDLGRGDRRARPTSRPTRCPDGEPAGARGERPVQGRRPRSNWANATHVCTCEVDPRHRAGDAAALHRRARTADR